MTVVTSFDGILSLAVRQNKENKKIITALKTTTFLAQENLATDKAVILIYINCKKTVNSSLTGSATG